jgi:hypothetical protein
VLYILRADDYPRQFVPPEVNFNAAEYSELTELDPNHPPPWTWTWTTSWEQLILPPYPNNTQAVEGLVRVVTEVDAKKGCKAPTDLKLLESRKMVPTFSTKKDDAKLA